MHVERIGPGGLTRLMVQGVDLAQDLAVEERAVRPVVHEVEDREDRDDLEEVLPDRAGVEADREGQDRQVEPEIGVLADVLAGLHAGAEALLGHLGLVHVAIREAHLLHDGDAEDELLAGDRERHEYRDVGEGGEPVVGHVHSPGCRG